MESCSGQSPPGRSQEKERDSNGGPAFPCEIHAGSQAVALGKALPITYHDGMTLADNFAGQAIAGLLANESWRKSQTLEQMAIAAYNMAMAMLAERTLHT